MTPQSDYIVILFFISYMIFKLVFKVREKLKNDPSLELHSHNYILFLEWGNVFG